MQTFKKLSSRFNGTDSRPDLNLYLNIIAHEIRNPLVSIQAYANLLVEKYHGCLPSEGLDYLDRISSNLQRVDLLLADITKLAHISIDESRFNLVDTRDLVDAALESHLLQLRQKKLTFDVDEILPELYCDASTMILVFSNLIGNAVKYCRDTADGNIHVGYLCDEIFHKFYVRDNGIGFSARDSRRVFQIFSRLFNKKNVNGSGLGLSIVQQVVEGHGGQVWAESRKNHGATFYFTLPKNSPGISPSIPEIEY